MSLLKFLGFKYFKQKGVLQTWKLKKGDELYTFIYHTDSYHYDLNETTRDVLFKSLLYTKDSNEAYSKMQEFFKTEYRRGIIKKILNK
jgi:hypothetical protein